jgi:hypothetical protein
MSKPVYKDNPYDYAWTVRKKNTATELLEPATGLTDLQGFIAATPGGATIHADLTLTLTERSGKPGSYYATVPVSAINARLFPTYDGQMVYLRVHNDDIDVSDPVPAQSSRPAG